MYQIQIYPITPDLWRYEIRCGGTLVYCGTAYTRASAESEAREVVHA